jgi:hypothetical protein
VIHAGWKGLANGIIGAVLTRIADPGEAVEAVIFAAAGPEKYEVGDEVISAIGASASYTLGAPGKYMLNLQSTVTAQLLRWNGAMSVAGADVCTISCEKLHSYRRDGSQSGRGVTFVVPRG